jgi:hypothetical protein
LWRRRRIDDAHRLGGKSLRRHDRRNCEKDTGNDGAAITTCDFHVSPPMRHSGFGFIKFGATADDAQNIGPGQPRDR